MKTTCRAKINLRLRVFARDDTGFHAVETLLLRTDLADEVVVEEGGDGVTIEVAGDAAAGVPEGPDNLCCRAAAAFLDVAFAGRRKRPGLRIGLTKRIPVGSGLGGGSADAAGVLRLLAERWPRVEPRSLYRVAGVLGSDVPFGLLDVPMALGWERGRRLLPLRPPRPRDGLVVCPPFAVSTPEAYGWLAAQRSADGSDAGGGRGGDPGGASVLPGVTRLAEWSTLERLVGNDLQAPVVGRHAALADALSILQDVGDASAMTGSGSALFAIFDRAAARERAVQSLADAGFGEEEGWKTHDIRLPI
ncbi:MAG: 4-(cytidine 5'-diphospho)-2-C-methyl-D-erythritol kinase [Gemmatimonadota bacterium]